MPTRSWTLVHVNYINENVGWQVPDIFCNGDYQYHEDALTALHHAEFRCAQYNERYPNRMKIPVLNSQLHYQKRGRVDLGEKARAKLGLPLEVETFTFPIRNIVILATPEDRSGTSKRAFGQVIRNGEMWSVVSRDNVRGILPDDMTWTNYSVQELKRRYGYPSNPFFHSTGRQVDGVLNAAHQPAIGTDSRTVDGVSVIKFTLFDTPLEGFPLPSLAPGRPERHTMTGRLPTEFIENFGTGYGRNARGVPLENIEWSPSSVSAVDFSQCSFDGFYLRYPCTVQDATLDEEGNIRYSTVPEGDDE